MAGQGLALRSACERSKGGGRRRCCGREHRCGRARREEGRQGRSKVGLIRESGSGPVSAPAVGRRPRATGAPAGVRASLRAPEAKLFGRHARDAHGGALRGHAEVESSRRGLAPAPRARRGRHGTQAWNAAGASGRPVRETWLGARRELLLLDLRHGGVSVATPRGAALRRGHPCCCTCCLLRHGGGPRRGSTFFVSRAVSRASSLTCLTRHSAAPRL